MTTGEFKLSCFFRMMLGSFFLFFSSLLLSQPLPLSIKMPEDKTKKLSKELLREYQNALKIETKTSRQVILDPHAPYALHSLFTRFEKKEEHEIWEVLTEVKKEDKTLIEFTTQKKVKGENFSESFIKGSLQELAKESFRSLEKIIAIKGTVISLEKDLAKVHLLSPETLPSKTNITFLRNQEIVGEGEVQESSLSSLTVKVKQGDIRIDDKILARTLPPSYEKVPLKKKQSFFKKVLVGLGAIGVGLFVFKKRDKAQPSSAQTATATSKAKTIQVTANPVSIPADGTSISTISALVKDENNIAVANDTPVVFGTTAGTIVISGGSTTASTKDGVATATLVAPTTAGSATITVTSGNATARATVTFTAVTSPPASIDLTSASTTISINSSGSDIGRAITTITATVRDSSGNAVANGTTVTFSTTLGTVTGQASTTNGVATTTFSSTTTGTATITAKAGSVSTSLTITVQPGPPHAIDIAANPQVIEADGHSFSTITATIRDVSGNLVTDGTQVNFSVTPDNDGGGNGDITSSSFTRAGQAMAILVSRVPGTTSTPASSGTATIVATVPTAQPAGIPAPAAAITNSKTQVTFASRVAANINFAAADTNLRGLDVLGKTTTITALVFDAKGNPVPDGTAVYFSVSGTKKNGMIEGSGPTIDGVAESKTVSGKATATFTTVACASLDSSNTIGSNLTTDPPPAGGVCDPDGSGPFQPGAVYIRVASGPVSRENLALIVTGPAYLQPGTNNFTTLTSPFGRSASGGTSPTNRFPLGGCKDQVTLIVNGRDINNNPVDDGLPVVFAASKGTVSSDTSFAGGVAKAVVATSSDCADPTPAGDGQLDVEILNSPGSNIRLTFYFKVQ